MLVLSWNLFHGRSLPPARRSLLPEFAAKLREWSWDVALLQEVPPWWPQSLARAADAEQCTALTSRNSLLVLRRAVAERHPELLKSNGGGSNAILARPPIAEQLTLRMRLRPERRVAQLVRLRDGRCIVNSHASRRASRAEQELGRLRERALAWAGQDPLVLGGDLNLRSPLVGDDALAHVASQGVDHVFARGFEAAGEAEALDHCVTLNCSAATVHSAVELSDHAPLRVRLSRTRL